MEMSLLICNKLRNIESRYTNELFLLAFGMLEKSYFAKLFQSNRCFSPRGPACLSVKMFVSESRRTHISKWRVKLVV